MLIEVGHAWNKPSLYSLLEVNLRSVWINNRCKLITCLQISALCWLRAISISCKACHRITTTLLLCKPLRCVQPVFAGHIGSPRMLKAAVIKDHIHHNLQALLMSLIAEAFIVLV